jgi:tRNA A-37 threonylcarbamoyl transferase component Bud32
MFEERAIGAGRTLNYECYPTKHDPVRGWYIIGPNLGESGAANLGVYRVCKDQDCEHIIKIGNSAKIKKEINIQNECAKHNLCKAVEDWWKCNDNKTAFVMPMLDRTLKEKLSAIGSINEESGNLIKDALSLIWRLHQIDIIHFDLNSGNIMMDSDGKLFLIDFGESKFIPNNNEEAAILISDDYGTFVGFLPSFLHDNKLLENISKAIFRMRHKYSAKDAEKIVLEKVLALRAKNFNDPTEVTKLIKSIQQLYEPPLISNPFSLIPTPPTSPTPPTQSPVISLPVVGSREIKSDISSYHRTLHAYVMSKKNVSEGKARYMIDLCINNVAFDLNITNKDVRNAIYNRKYIQSLQ